MKTLFASFIAVAALFAGFSSAQAAPSDDYGPGDSIIVFTMGPSNHLNATLDNFASVAALNSKAVMDAQVRANDDWCIGAIMMPDIRRSDRAWPSKNYLDVLRQIYSLPDDYSYLTPYNREVVRRDVELERRRCSQFLGHSRDREAGQAIIMFDPSGSGKMVFRSIATARRDLAPVAFDQLVAQNRSFCTPVTVQNVSNMRGVIINTTMTGPYARVYGDLIRPVAGSYFEEDFVRFELVRGTERFCSSFLNNASRF